MDVYLLHAYVSPCGGIISKPMLTTVTISRFMKALEAQGMSRQDLPYTAPFQPWGSWFALIATAIITLFKGESSSALRLPRMLNLAI